MTSRSVVPPTGFEHMCMSCSLTQIQEAASEHTGLNQMDSSLEVSCIVADASVPCGHIALVGVV